MMETATMMTWHNDEPGRWLTDRAHNVAGVAERWEGGWTVSLLIYTPAATGEYTPMPVAHNVPTLAEARAIGTTHVALARVRSILADYDRVPELVAQAREAGATWDAVADALGVTRQAASKRYGEVAP